jgi:hypothetical protein
MVFAKYATLQKALTANASEWRLHADLNAGLNSDLNSGLKV